MNNTKNNTPNAPTDFTPTLGDYNYLHPLRYWCNKILPMVYDDSLSYYELLCKVVYKLNAVIDNINELPNYIAKLISDDKLKEIMGTIINELEAQIASANEGTSKTATVNREVGELVWLDGELFKIIHPMIAGDQYVSGSNCIPVTIENLIKNVYYPSQELLVINALVDDEHDVNRRELK